MSKKRTELSLKEKINLIKDSPGKSQRLLADKYGIGKTQVHSILKRKAELLEGYEDNCSNKRKRLSKKSPVEDINNLMWEWFQMARSQGIPVSGPMLQEKALVYAAELGISTDEFKASNGWLCCFRNRHNISFASVCGESGSVSQETVADWKDKLPSIIAGYSEKDIYNMDETGLFFRALPDKSLSVRGEDCKGGKRSKDRLTVMLCCVNMEGDFETLLVIGKCAKPRYFRHINPASLPVTWRFNKKAWMNTFLFTEWIKSFDKKMKRAGRNVLLLLDNATSHPHELQLTNVKMIFLPANTTSVLQPLDQGIIQNVKQLYRKRLIRCVLSKIDSDEKSSAVSLSKSVNVLDAFQWVASCVKQVRPETVRKCFIKTGIVFPSECTISDSDDEDDDIPIAELVQLMQAASEQIKFDSVMSFQEYVHCDVDLQVNEDINPDWENNLIDNLKTKDAETENVIDSDDEEEAEQLLIKSDQDALKWLAQVKMYCLTRDFVPISLDLGKSQEELEKETLKNKCASKQSTIDMFFSK